MAIKKQALNCSTQINSKWQQISKGIAYIINCFWCLKTGEKRRYSSPQIESMLEEFQNLVNAHMLQGEKYERVQQVIIQEITQAVEAKQLIKYFKSVKDVHFNDGKIIQQLLEQLHKLESSYQELDIIGQRAIVLALLIKTQLLTKPAQEYFFRLAEQLARRSLSSQMSFNSLNLSMSLLQKIQTNDNKLCIDTIKSILLILPTLDDQSFSLLLQKAVGIVTKLKSNVQFIESYVLVNQVLSEIFENEVVKSRVLDISVAAKQVKQSNNHLNDFEMQSVIVGRLVFSISKQISLQQANNPQVSSSYKQILENFSVFLEQNYQKLNDNEFKTILLALSSARIGSQQLYNLLMKEFSKRIVNQKNSNQPLHKDFFCICLRTFCISRHFSLDLSNYIALLKKTTQKLLKNLNPDNKLTLITSFSVIREEQIVNEIAKETTINDIRKLSRKGQMQLFWSLSNSSVFNEEFIKVFINTISKIPNQDAYYKDNIYELVQTTQSLYILKHTQPDIWQSLSIIQIEQTFEQLVELTHIYHSKIIQADSSFKNKTVYSIDLSDILTALGLEFSFEPVIEKVFNVDFLVKNITQEKLNLIKDSKEQILEKFSKLKSDIRSQNYKKEIFSSATVNKVQDILIEIDGVNHFVAGDKKRQATETKQMLLKKLGYNFIQIDYFQLQKIASSNSNQAIESFIEFLENGIKS